MDFVRRSVFLGAMVVLVTALVAGCGGSGKKGAKTSGSTAGSWYSVIKGADACLKKAKTCDLSQGIVISGNDITFHLTKVDPEFLDQLAMPFTFALPASTPAKQVNLPPPGTGPYKWVQYA